MLLYVVIGSLSCPSLRVRGSGETFVFRLTSDFCSSGERVKSAERENGEKERESATASNAGNGAERNHDR
jgi:hypothetical protein